MTTLTTPKNPFESELPTNTLLVRPKNGGRPFIYFKPRGNETVWALTLEKIFGRDERTFNHRTLLAIGPHLMKAVAEVGEHVHHRQDHSPTPFTGGLWNRRIHGTPTSALLNIHTRLLELSRRYIALDLIQRFFPDRLGEVTLDEDWVATLRRFLKYVEDQEWFPLNWEVLDLAYYEIRAMEEVGSDEWLAEFLINIPLPAIAPVEECLEDSCTRTLYGLFVNSWLLSRELKTYGIDEPQVLNNEAIYNRVLAMEAEFADLEYPLNFLPGIARLYRRETGFAILDTPGIEGVSTPWGALGEFTWEDDALRMRAQWQAASPLVDQFNAFHCWMEEDERHFDRAISLILQAGGVI